MDHPVDLEQRLRRTLPAARLAAQTLPGLPDLRLWLLDPDYPRTPVSSSDMQAIWQEPAYWIFCWASGLAMARHLLAHPEIVRGKRVLDFGAGSGVVGVAAARAGAAEVIACDIDPLALAACRANAALNGVSFRYLEDFFALDGRVDVLLAADVLYDASNRFSWTNSWRGPTGCWLPIPASRISRTRPLPRPGRWRPPPGPISTNSTSSGPCGFTRPCESVGARLQGRHARCQFPAQRLARHPVVFAGIAAQLRVVKAVRQPSLITATAHRVELLRQLRGLQCHRGCAGNCGVMTDGPGVQSQQQLHRRSPTAHREAETAKAHRG